MLRFTYQDSVYNSPEDTKHGATKDKVVSDFNLEEACFLFVRHMIL